MEIRFAARFKEALSGFGTRKNSSQEEEDFRTYRMSRKETAKTLLLLLSMLGLLSYVFYDSFLPMVLLFPGAAVFFLKRERKKRAEARDEQLKKEFLTGASLLGDYLRSGYSIENAIRGSVSELAEVWGEDSSIVGEWRRMEKHMSLNMSAEEAFKEFGRRTGIEQIREFSEIFSIVKRSGGRLHETVASVTGLLTEQFAVEDQIRTMTAAKRYEQRIMDVMPVGILMYIRLTSPGLLTVMYTTWTGRLAMTVCLAMYAAAFLWAEKIIAIKV